MGEALQGRRARRRRRADRRGVALVMVLGAITVLTVFLTELQEETSAELSAALAERDALKAEYYARSGVNLSRLVIATEPTVRNVIAPISMMMGMKSVPQIPIWNFADMLLGPFNDQTGAAAFAGAAGIDASTGKNLGLTGGGRFELRIVDEESKINVNLAAKGNLSFEDQKRVAEQLLGLIGPQQYNEMFEGRDPDDQFSDRATICGAIIDWADFDGDLNLCNPLETTASASGVEDNYYQTIQLDYVRKNAAFDSLEELRMIRGIGDDFWATFVDPDPGDPTKRNITVWGPLQAKVNVNSVNPMTLWSVICPFAEENTPACNPADTEQVVKFLGAIGLVRSFTQGLPIFGGGKDFLSALEGKGMFGSIFTMLEIQPIKIQSKYKKQLTQMLTAESKFFSIYAEGVVPGNKRETRVRIHAVIDTSGAAAPGQGSGLPLSSTNASGQGTSLGEVPPGAYEQAFRMNPAGTVVYWRIE